MYIYMWYIYVDPYECIPMILGDPQSIELAGLEGDACPCALGYPNILGFPSIWGSGGSQYMGMPSHILGFPSIWDCIPYAGVTH